MPSHLPWVVCFITYTTYFSDQHGGHPPLLPEVGVHHETAKRQLNYLSLHLIAWPIASRESSLTHTHTHVSCKPPRGPSHLQPHSTSWLAGYSAAGPFQLRLWVLSILSKWKVVVYNNLHNIITHTCKWNLNDVSSVLLCTATYWITVQLNYSVAVADTCCIVWWRGWGGPMVFVLCKCKVEFPLYLLRWHWYEVGLLSCFNKLHRVDLCWT